MLLPLKYILFLSISLSLIGCSNNSKTEKKTIKIDTLNSLNNILFGQTLGTKQPIKKISENFYCLNTLSNNLVEEVNLIFTQKNKEDLYLQLLKKYNTHFKSNKSDDRFNSWSINSVEILLFKQADNTILVNIFSKTYK